MNDFTDTANLAPANVIWRHWVMCTELLNVVSDEEVGAVLPVLAGDVPLAVHGGQPHPHPDTVWVTVTIVQIPRTLVSEGRPGVQPPVSGGPGGHHPSVSDADCISHSQTQSADHKISRLDNLFLLPRFRHEAGLTIVTDWRQQSPGASRKFLHLICLMVTSE